MNEKETVDMTNTDQVADKWQTTDVNWTAIQRRRFMNADAEIDPEDNYSKKWKKEINE